MFELRKYQTDCVSSIMKAWKSDYNKVGAVLPTGAGKTEIFIEVCRRYIEQNLTKSVLILSHLSLLTTQTKERFASRCPELSIAVLQADKFPDKKTNIIISTMQSSRSSDKMDEWASVQAVFHKEMVDIDLVIIDEAHYIQTESYEKILEYFKNCKVLGVTATPYRDGRLMTNYFDTIAYTISLQELIDEGHLVPPELKQIVMPMGGGDATDRMARVANLYLTKERGKKALVFMNSIKNAKAMKLLLKDNNINAKCITSELTGEKRDVILNDFRSGDVQVLTTVNVLTAGFDAPVLEAIFMPYATNSPTLYMQRIGRGLRIAPDKRGCRVYCFGEPPSIKKGVFKKVHEMALYGGSSDIAKNTLRDDLEYMDLVGISKSSEEYVWTNNICIAADKLKALNAKGLEKLLIHRTFPKRFLDNLPKLIANLPLEVQLTGEERSPTARQIQTLQMNGFVQKQIDEMNMVDASNMIATISNMRKEVLAGESWVVPSGKYMGTHVKDLPYVYKNFVLRKYPFSFVAKIIKKYEQEGE